MKIEKYPHIDVFIENEMILVQGKYTYIKDSEYIKEIIHEINIPVNLDIPIILRVIKFILDDSLLIYGRLSDGVDITHVDITHKDYIDEGIDFISMRNITLDNWEYFTFLFIDYIKKYNEQ